MYSSDELFQRSRDGYFGVYFPSCEATREIITKITLDWAQKQFVTRVHTLFYFLHDITTIKMTKNDDRHTSTLCLTHWVYVLLMTSQSIGHDVTMTGQLWSGHVTNDILLVRYWFNSRRYSRHGRSCKKKRISLTRHRRIGLPVCLLVNTVRLEQSDWLTGP